MVQREANGAERRNGKGRKATKGTIDDNAGAEDHLQAGEEIC